MYKYFLVVLVLCLTTQEALPARSKSPEVQRTLDVFGLDTPARVDADGGETFEQEVRSLQLRVLKGRYKKAEEEKIALQNKLKQMEAEGNKFAELQQLVKKLKSILPEESSPALQDAARALMHAAGVPEINLDSNKPHIPLYYESPCGSGSRLGVVGSYRGSLHDSQIHYGKTYSSYNYNDWV